MNDFEKANLYSKMGLQNDENDPRFYHSFALTLYCQYDNNKSNLSYYIHLPFKADPPVFPIIYPILLHAPELGVHVDFIRPPGLQCANFMNDGFG